jgi:hypothetical protein
MKMERIPFEEIRKIVKKKYKDEIIFTVLLFMQSKGKNKESTTYLKSSLQIQEDR